MNKFRFVGKIGLNALDSKIPYKREGKTDKGGDYVSFNCIVSSDKNNRAFCEIFGATQDEIRTFDTNGDQTTVSWNSRFDEDVIKNVAYGRLYTIKMNGERNQFISPYDFTKFLIQHAEEIKDKIFIVTGDLVPNEYKGKISQRYQIRAMYELEQDEKLALNVDLDYTWIADSIDLGDWASKKIININGYINENINKTVKKKYVLQPVILDASKIDFTNAKHVLALNMKLKQIGLEYADGEIKSHIKKSEVCKLPFKCRYINGAEEVEFDEKQLTDNQRAMVECGLMSLDDFKPKGRIYGERITIYKVYSFDLRDDYANGRVIVKDVTANDMTGMIYTPGGDNAPEPVSKVNEGGVDLDDLFNS